MVGGTSISDYLQVRYRPRLFSQVIGQDHITSILKGLVRYKSYKVMRSLIFSGQFGGGKSTLGMIMANAIICDNPQDGEPCLECESCRAFASGQYQDFTILDAGHYNKIEDVTKLLDIAKIYPVHSNKNRVIIIEESHRISGPAQDSMLLLLEGGATRTIFIFTTTEITKMRPALVSRSASLQVRPLSVKEIQNELVRICNAENIPYDNESIMAVAYANNGKMRDAIKTLDLYNRTQGSLTNIQIKSDNEYFCEILRLIALRKQNEALDILDQMSTRKDLGAVLCDTLSALYCFPNNLISGVPELTLRNTKTILDKSLRRTIELYMQYKPNTYEQIKLFLLILSDANSKSDKVTTTQRTKRQLFKAKEKPQTQEDDEL